MQDIVTTSRNYLSERNRTGILRGLGAIGWESYENNILAFLLHGGPILLVGGHGTNKTRLTENLATALGICFGYYDASKATWDDIVGFPDPAKLMNIDLRDCATGIPRIETKTSIWNKELILVDEINRCSPENQSKWLELILSRTLMGEETKVKWIISAMNPGYAGTYPLDLALASRYLLFLNTPNTNTMSDDNLLEILEQDNPKESPAIYTWMNPQLEKDGAIKVLDNYLDKNEKHINKFILASYKLKCLLIVAASNYNHISNVYQDNISKYITAVTTLIRKETKGYIITDPRRLRMMQAMMLSSISVHSAIEDTETLDSIDIKDIAFDILLKSYPNIALLDGPSPTVIQAAHLVNCSLLENKSSPIYKISIEPNPLNKLLMLIDFKDRDTITTIRIIEQILDVKDIKEKLIILHTIIYGLKMGLELDIQTISNISKIYSSIENVEFNIPNKQIKPWMKIVSDCTTAGQLVSLQIAILKLNPNTITASVINQITQEKDIIYNKLSNNISKLKEKLNEHKLSN